jgi:hypothetical protein
MLLTRTQYQTCKPATTADDTRYALHGVHVARDHDQTVATATNGHLLIRVTETVPPDRDFPMGDAMIGPDQPAALVPLAILDSAFKLAPKKGGVPVLQTVLIADGHVTASDLATRQTAPLPAESKSFPDASRVIPQPEDGEITIPIGGHVLKALADACKAFHESPRDGGMLRLVIRPSTIQDGVVTGTIGIRATAHNRTLIGAMMPRRYDK